MATEFKVPELGEGVESAEVSRIHVSEGDTIEADQTVMELETEKAVADLPCPHAGKITKIHVSKGDTIHIGQTILTIEGDGDGKGTSKDEAAERGEDEQEADDRQEEEVPKEEEVESQHADETEQEPAEKVSAEARAEDAEDVETPLPAGPATRRLAKKLDIDLHEVQGSGPRGRIRTEDVVAAHDRKTASKRKTTSKSPAQQSRPELPDFRRWGPVEEQPLNKIGRSAVQQLVTSWNLIPHVTQHDLADITELEEARRRYHETDGDAGPKITLTAIAIKAVAAVLQEFPRFNSSLNETGDTLIL
ncbi:MAG: 2-oxo acid dehydrogenase subunit E2, partial [Planctomycetes bacterium]|nr:2-oxo acid dehydrogenase subunit E2 [Planctomycetota bacterium]